MNKVEIIANSKCWIEDNAKNQLNAISKLNGVERIVGLPDLHAGKIPIGIAVATKGVIYPHIIGGDIGCGMTLIKTGIKNKKFKIDRCVKKLEKLRGLEKLGIENPYEDESPIYPLGTIGGGNHFAEFQSLNKIYDKEEWDKLNICDDDIFLLIHSGSRGYGEKILDEYDVFGGLNPESELGKAYIEKHEHAVVWAERNRKLVGDKLLDYLGYSVERECIISCNHNFLEKDGEFYIHRKGATSTKSGAVIIPGSRGDLTYLVMPKANTEKSLSSLSHGAGRKWPRSLCKGRLEKNFTLENIKSNKFNSRIVCKDVELIYQESPKAYKKIEDVIESLVEFELITVIATFKPVLTFKG